MFSLYSFEREGLDSLQMATIIFEGKRHQVRPTVVAQEQPRYIVNTKLAKNQSVEIIFPDILMIHKKMLKVKKKGYCIHL